MEATITFRNGTKITAEVNGDCYITQERPSFPADLNGITVTKEEGDTTYQYTELIECASTDGRYWFALRETPADIRAARQMQANIEYIAMMTDVELEEE